MNQHSAIKSPETNSPIQNMRIGLYNKNFKMTEPTFFKTETCNIRRFQAIFDITAGPLFFGGQVLKETFVLEIRYKDSADAHARTLPLNGWNSQLIYDYGEKVHELALKFIKEQGWILNNHLNSWPEFQAIVSKDPSKKVVEDTKQTIDDVLWK